MAQKGSSIRYPRGGENTAVIRERVANNERSILNLQGEMREIFTTMATQHDLQELNASMGAINAKLDNVGKPQWQGISVGVTVIAILGALVYWPIREKQSDQASLLQLHEQRLVPRAEHQHEWERQDKINDRFTTQLDEIQKEVWKAHK